MILEEFHQIPVTSGKERDKFKRNIQHIAESSIKIISLLTSF